MRAKRAFWHHFTGPRGPARISRFWSQVKVGGPSECWPWNGEAMSRTIGRMKVAGRENVRANRIAWAIANEADPGQHLVLASCEFQSCCNPSHLRLGSVADQRADMIARGRQRLSDQRGEKNGNTILSDADIAQIVDRFRRGQSNTRIGREFGVTHSNVSAIRRGLSWLPQTSALGWQPRPQFMRRNPT